MPATMSTDAARQIIRCALAGHECRMIQFFGGEPTLNMDGMEAAIDEIRRLVKTGELEKAPRFTVVTNGAFSDPIRTMETFLSGHVEVTVSLDGPPHIHDALRPYHNSKPSYDDVTNSISMLREAGLPVAIESVYTALHVREHVSVVDLFRLCKELGVERLLLDIAKPPVPSDLNPVHEPYTGALLAYFCEGVNWWFENLVRGIQPLQVYFREILLPMLNGAAGVDEIHGCGAAQSDLVIGPRGDVYSCQLAYGYPDFWLGNLINGECLKRPVTVPVAAIDFNKCATCYGRHWCQPCVALNHLWGDKANPPELECMLRLAVIRRIGELAFRYLNLPENAITAELREAISMGTT